MDDGEFEAALRAFDERRERRHIATLQRLEQFDQEINEIRETTRQRNIDSEQRVAQQINEIRETTRRRNIDSEQRVARIDQQIKELHDARQLSNLEFDQKLAESERQFKERLELFDQRDTALLRRLEQLREQVDLLSGDSRQITNALVEHKRDPDAHG